MNKKELEKFGEDIRRTVQDAIENQNYEKLNQVIMNTVSQATEAVANGIKQTKHRGYKFYTTDFEYAKRSREDSVNKTKQAPVVIEIKTPSKTRNIVAAVLGYSFGIYELYQLIIAMIARLIVNNSIGSIIIILYGILSGALSALGFGIGIRGTKNIYRIERFKVYLSALGSKEYCNLSDLALKVEKPIQTVLKDLEYMIKKKWLKQGHLDTGKTCLMVTDKMYEQYCQLEQQRTDEQKAIKEREEREQKFKDEQIAAGKQLSPEVQKVIDQGDEYLRKIRKCNDDIPGEEISEKIYRIEILVDRIFDRVEQNPKCVSDIRKLMDYYLPTTIKLLEAYAQMDAQPVGGENIQTAKREIEATLDTLNVAFEKLLDDLFQDTAWDVSSDISVLNTMLAQEGLKEDGLKGK